MAITASTITTTMRYSRGRFMTPALKPSVQSEHQLQVISRFAMSARKVGGVARALPVYDADVGCDLPADLVAQPEPEFRIRKTRASVAPRIVTTIQIEL